MSIDEKDEDAWFWKLLAKACSPSSPLPWNEQAIDIYLSEHPLTPQETSRATAAVHRLRLRLRGQKPDSPFEDKDDVMLARMSESELVELYRNQGKSTPEIERQLELLRRKIREQVEKQKKDQPGSSPQGDKSGG